MSTGFKLILATIAATALAPFTSEAATVGSDGGITLWVSYDNSNAGPLDIDDTVAIVQSTAGAGCAPTNIARSVAGAPNSPGQCPGGSGSCTGREKVTGDIQRFAEYVWQSTDGASYIRRVYVADGGRSWDTADIQWNMNLAGSTGATGGWDDVGNVIRLRSSARACIHDVLHHEFGHYFHRLPDRYDRDVGYYLGTKNGGSVFDVDVEIGDPNTVMASNFPHLFNDTTNASITVDYQAPGESFTDDEVLTPSILTDSDPDNDGPDRAHHGFTEPFAQDDWAMMPGEHVHLSGVHTEGDFSAPAGTMPSVDIVFLDGSTPVPGTVLLLDRSGSMSVQTDGVPASQYVQEAGLYLYHSSLPSDLVGTYLYNANVEELFEYTTYDPTNQLPQANFRSAQGLTDIAGALKRAIDELVAEHGEAGVNGAQIVLMSDGRQTTGADLWDEVDRANMLGIQIHTFSFGNADATTMAQIATNTSGGNTELSERSDAFALKMGMAHEFSNIRGFTPVHIIKEILKPTDRIKKGEIFEGSFVIPPFSRNLAFYSFLKGGDASSYELELVDPAGSVILGRADSIAKRGRFNGVKAEKPKPGLWKYRVVASKETDFVLPQTQPFELNAYVRNPTLDARIWTGRFDARPGVVRVYGQVNFRYPLTDLRARVYIYREGALRGVVQLFDDGKNGDDHARDGVFTGLLNLGEFGLDRPLDGKRSPKTRLDCQFFIDNAAQPAPNAHYETGTSIKSLQDDYQKHGRSKLPFEVWSTATIDFSHDSIKRDRGGLRLLDPDKLFKVNPGEEGKLFVRLLGLRPIQSLLRMSLGQGIDLKLLEYRSLKRQLGADLVLQYAVGNSAKEGPRDLRIQQGGAKFAISPAIFVAQ